MQCYQEGTSVQGLDPNEFLASGAARGENFAISHHVFLTGLEGSIPEYSGIPSFANRDHAKDYRRRMRAERLASVFRAGRWVAFNPEYWKRAGNQDCEYLPRPDGPNDHKPWQELSKALTTKLRHAPRRWERVTITAYEDARLSWDELSQWAATCHTCQRIAGTQRGDTHAATRVLACIAQRYMGKDRIEFFWCGNDVLAVRAIQGHTAGGIGSRANPFACGWKQLRTSQHAPFLYHTVSTSPALERGHRGRSGITLAERLALISRDGILPGIDAT